MAAIGLKSQIWNNNLKSIALLAFYPLLMAGLCWAVAAGSYYVFAPSGDGYYISAQGGMPLTHYGAADKSSSAFAYANTVIIAYWPTILTVIALWFIIAYAFQGRMIQRLSHAHSVTRKDEPELYNLLENLCISRGMTMPHLQIIETHARNAFASGINDASYTVTVTRGLLRSLEKDEIEAVLAHELAHIQNRDVRLLIVSVIFTGMIGFFAQMTWSIIRYNMIFSIGSRRRERGDMRVVLVLLVFAAILWVGYLATIFTRFALSRRREYMADAGAIEMTKNPQAMMRALLRISGKDSIPEATDDIALMCIENSRNFMGLFATHPPIEKRIAAISAITGEPIPQLKPGSRTENRFEQPQDHQKDNKNPWLTATRAGRSGKRNPWSNPRD